MRRSLSALLTVAAVATLLVSVPTMSYAVTTAECDQQPGLDRAPLLESEVRPDGSPVRAVTGDDGVTVPVLFIHGYRGESDHNDSRTGAFSKFIDLSALAISPDPVTRSLIGQIQDIPGAEVFTFDYKKANERWVTEDRIGPEVAKSIDCLYEATGQKLTVVAHSMGGLAIREALSLESPDRISRAEKVSDVITFGTPNLGSPWSSGGRFVLEATDSAAAAAKTVITMFGSGCQRTDEVAVLGSVCELMPLLNKDTAALRGMAAGSPELAKLARWPDGVKVHALSGQLTVTMANYGWFGVKIGSTTTDLGDWVVGSDSATHNADTARALTCPVDLTAKLDVNKRLTSLVLRTATEELSIARAATACAHGNLMRSAELTNEALGIINETVTDQLPPPMPESLSTITAPEMCMHESGNLVEGTLPGIPAQEGGTYISGYWGGDQTWAVNPNTQGSQGVKYAVVFQCDAGGVSWPESIGFYDARLNLIGSVHLEDLDSNMHSVVQTLAFSGGSLGATWVAYEGAGFARCTSAGPNDLSPGLDDRSGTFTVQGDGSISVSNLTSECDSYPTEDVEVLQGG